MTSNKPTYLVVTPFFPSEESFIGSYIFDQVETIRSTKKYDIHIVKLSSFFSNERDYIYKGFNVSIFKLIDFPFFIFPGCFHAINKMRFENLLSIKNLQHLKICHAHVTYPAAYLISDMRCKKIVQHHGLDVLQLRNGRVSFLRHIQRKYLIRRSIKILNQVDINIGVSSKVLESLSSFRTYHPKKDFVLYNGVDITKFYPIGRKKDQCFTIGCIGNFWKSKDHITLIKSVAILIRKNLDIRLRLIGSGRTLSECRQYVIDNNLTDVISFEDEMPHDRLNNFYNEIDLFVLPSYDEALGCVYLEAWATNTPFIAVAGQGIEEVMSEEMKRRSLIMESDETDLSEKISYFYYNRCDYLFDQQYAINNTISKFLNNQIFIS